jgi:hypothetical protein
MSRGPEGWGVLTTIQRLTNIQILGFPELYFRNFPAFEKASKKWLKFS